MAELITISSVEDGTRLLRWFVRHFPGMPQRDFYKLCRGGQIRLNSSRCKGMEILKTNDVLRIPPTMMSYKKIPTKTENGEKFSLEDLEKLRLNIIYDDDDLVVFNKPAGLAVQGGTGIRKSIDKMAEALFPYHKISLVHRLDKETSGVLVVAKNQKSAQVLSAQFQNKTAQKYYLALLYGSVPNKHGVIDNYILKGKIVDNVSQQEKKLSQRAITEYNVLGEVPGFLTWVQFIPKTGRNHQLRIHSALTLKTPIVGDTLYGDDNLVKNKTFSSIMASRNLFLFAYKIVLKHPRTGKLLTVRADLPSFMQPVTKLLELHIPED
ncbi:MAG: RluA family pseudouridine synthase [Alphaproteobacteria bacterium]|nr:RluA family pseudouridine synthase [Alphaproteobacteria bacterium]